MACFLMAFFVLALVPTETQAQGVAASVRAGTQGIGVDLATRLMPRLNARVGVNYFTYAMDGVEDIDDTEVAYDADATLLFVSAVVDYHPFANSFRLSGGVHYNGLEGNSTLEPQENIEAGNNSYTPEQVGTLGLEVGFASKISPYVGIGFGNAISRRVGFLFDVGMLYAGAPEVNITATGMLSPTAGESSKVEDNLSWAKWYPVVSLGVSARLSN